MSEMQVETLPSSISREETHSVASVSEIFSDGSTTTQSTNRTSKGTEKLIEGGASHRSSRSSSRQKSAPRIEPHSVKFTSATAVNESVGTEPAETELNNSVRSKAAQEPATANESESADNQMFQPRHTKVVESVAVEDSIEFDLEDCNNEEVSTGQVTDKTDGKPPSRAHGESNLPGRTSDESFFPHPPRQPPRSRPLKQRRVVIRPVRDIFPETTENQPVSTNKTDNSQKPANAHNGARKAVSKEKAKPLTSEEILAIKYRELQELLNLNTAPTQEIIDRQVSIVRNMTGAYSGGKRPGNRARRSNNQAHHGENRPSKGNNRDVEEESEDGEIERNRKVKVNIEPHSIIYSDTQNENKPRLLRRSQQRSDTLRVLSFKEAQIPNADQLAGVSYPSPAANLSLKQTKQDPQQQQQQQQQPQRSLNEDLDVNNLFNYNKAKNFKRSDNYISHNDNPSVRKWLRVKNREMRRQRRAERRKLHQEMLLEEFQRAEAEQRKRDAQAAYNKWLRDLAQRQKDAQKGDLQAEASENQNVVADAGAVGNLDSTAFKQPVPPPSRPKSGASTSSVRRGHAPRSATITPTPGELVRRPVTAAVAPAPAAESDKQKMRFEDWLERKKQDAALEKEKAAKKQAEKQAAVDPEMAKLLPELLKKRHEERDAQKRRVDSGLNRKNSENHEAVEFKPQPEAAETHESARANSNPYAIMLDDLRVSVAAQKSSSARLQSGRKSAADVTRDRRIDAITHERENPFANVAAPWERPPSTLELVSSVNTNRDDSVDGKKNEKKTPRTAAETEDRHAKEIISPRSARVSSRSLQPPLLSFGSDDDISSDFESDASTNREADRNDGENHSNS